MEEVAFQLHVANAVWGQQGYPFLPEYLDLLAQNYGAGVRLVDLETAHFRYREGDGYQAIQLPYLNREVAMVVVLPQEGRFREIEERLTGEWAQGVVRGFREHEVILTMPKFRLKPPRRKLGETLSAMGMPSAFSHDDADFIGIVERQPNLYIWIGDVLPQAFIDVDEKRTEAAAASVVIVIEKGIEPTKPPPIIMKIDRHFIFFIRDIETDAILFVGRVMNPASE